MSNSVPPPSDNQARKWLTDDWQTKWVGTVGADVISKLAQALLDERTYTRDLLDQRDNVIEAASKIVVSMPKTTIKNIDQWMTCFKRRVVEELEKK